MNLSIWTGVFMPVFVKNQRGGECSFFIGGFFRLGTSIMLVAGPPEVCAQATDHC